MPFIPDQPTGAKSSFVPDTAAPKTTFGTIQNTTQPKSISTDFLKYARYAQAFLTGGIGGVFTQHAGFEKPEVGRELVSGIAKPIGALPVQFTKMAAGGVAGLAGQPELEKQIMAPSDIPVLGEVKTPSAYPIEGTQTPGETLKQAGDIYLTGGAPGAAKLLGKVGGAIMETKAAKYATPYVEDAMKALLSKGKGIWESMKEIPIIGKALGGEELAAGTKAAEAVPSVLGTTPESVPISEPIKKAAEKAGLHPRLIDLVEGGSAQDKEAMRTMVNQAENYSKSYMAEHPNNVPGEAMLDRVKHLQEVNAEAGSKLGEAVKVLPAEPVSVQDPLNKFLRSLDEMGVKFTRNGLDFSASSLSGTNAGPSQKMLEKAFEEVIGEGSAELNPKRIHTLRQSIFSELGLGKEGAQLDSRAQVVLENLRQNLGGVLEQISPTYTAASKDYAITEKALQGFENLMGKKFGNVTPEILKKRAGEVAGRLLSNVPANVERVIGDLEEAAKATGYVPKDSLLRQTAFADALKDIFEITKPRSFQGGIEAGTQAALENVGIGLKAARGDIAGVGEAIYKKAVGRTPEKAREALKALLSAGTETAPEVTSVAGAIPKGEIAKTVETTIPKASTGETTSLAKSSKDLHFNLETKAYSPERQALHKEIIDKELAKVPSGRKDFHIVTGHSASGKSTFVNDVIDQKNNLVIDADRLKPMLPEAKKSGGAFVHDETSDMTVELIRQAAKANKPVVLVGNIKDTPKYQEMLKMLKELDYNITADEVKTSKAVALHRAMQRSMSHQPVPVTFANDAYNQFTAGSNLLKKNMSRFVSYSGEKPFLSQLSEATKLSDIYKKP